MAKQKDFDKFLSEIEPSHSTVSYISSVQKNLRDYLTNHENYKNTILDTFLSGSYAKHTSIRPKVGDKKRDVDIVVVTNYTSEKNSNDVLEELCDVLSQKELYKSASLQSHSVSVELEGISVDIVPVIEHETHEDLYYIASNDGRNWEMTDPKGHKSWSSDFNQNSNDKYKPLIKIFKWWRRTNCPDDKKYPKGITLEKIIADNIGNTTLSTEDLTIETMQNIVDFYNEKLSETDEIPFVEDPSDFITDNNLLEGYELDEFKEFIEKLEGHLKLLNDEGTTNVIWRTILGTEFPCEKLKCVLSDATSGGYLTVSHRQKPLWPIHRTGAVFISATVKDRDGIVDNYESDSYDIEKHCEIVYTAHYNSCKAYTIKWQIVNTGSHANEEKCLRGGFEDSNRGSKSRKETTLYTGKHYVQCFVINKQGICVARSKEFFINVK